LRAAEFQTPKPIQIKQGIKTNFNPLEEAVFLSLTLRRNFKGEDGLSLVMVKIYIGALR
jgi:hypothetical protein